MRSSFFIIVLLVIVVMFQGCAKPPEKITCKPYLKITDTGSELSMWDLNHNREATGACDEYIPQEFAPVEIGS